MSIFDTIDILFFFSSEITWNVYGYWEKAAKTNDFARYQMKDEDLLILKFQFRKIKKRKYKIVTLYVKWIFTWEKGNATNEKKIEKLIFLLARRFIVTHDLKWEWNAAMCIGCLFCPFCWLKTAFAFSLSSVD